MKRRVFLRDSGFALAGACLLPVTVSGCKGSGPNDLINIGMIGTGSHGVDYNLKHYLDYPQLCRVVAVCDVSMSRATSAMNLVNNTYKNDDCKGYQDFRELLDNRSIDAVQISTPDHWHVPISIMAALKGKHICCEKPTLTIDEGRLLCNVIKKTGIVYQLSMEDRYVPVYHQIAEIARNGRLGRIKHIEVELPIPRLPKEGLEITTPPADLDYDMWLGPVKEIPYIYSRTFFSFRWYDAFSGGILTDWGAHLCDTAQIVADADSSGPSEVTPMGETLFYNDGIFNTAYQFDLNYKYPDNTTLRVTGGEASIRVEGEEGWIESPGWRQPVTVSDEKILDLSNKKIELPTNVGEHKNFLDTIKSGAIQVYKPEISHRDSTLLHLGNIALKLNRKVEWDPVNEKFINDPEADKFKRREMREKWSYEKICPKFKY
jgi:predicted dehydrogenase